VLLGAAVLIAAALTWILPAGQYERREDAATGRRVVVANTYHSVARAPVGLFGAAVAIPRGFVAAADVVAVVIFVGGAWVIVDRLGTLPAVVDALVVAFAGRGLLIIPVVAVFFATMGALENMQEEIIPIVPALLALGTGLGIDAVAVVAMSAGAAMVGSAFGPTNPFQAGIALRLAELPPFSGGLVRLGLFVVGVGLWIAWTMRYARITRRRGALLRAVGPSGTSTGTSSDPSVASRTANRRHFFILALVLLPMAVYVYGALRLDWGFNELSAAFVIGGVLAGLVGGLGIGGTVVAYLEGMQALLPAALMVAVARSISLVLEDGRIVDTILFGLVSPLARMPVVFASVLMIPFQALLHIAVPSVSGQAVLTMPLFVPLADVLGVSRQVPVLAYQTGAGLMELATPTNGALMAVLLAAGVPFSRWIRFALGALVLLSLAGAVGLLILR
jgi:uncharacterized ion transporter superfamily protein YfcC